MKKISEKTISNAAMAYVVLMIVGVCVWANMEDSMVKTLLATALGTTMVCMTAAMVAWSNKR